MNFCTSCQHYSITGHAWDENRKEFCLHPKNEVLETNPVNGVSVRQYRNCHEARYSLAGCTLEGRWFEENTPKLSEAGNSVEAPESETLSPLERLKRKKLPVIGVDI